MKDSTKAWWIGTTPRQIERRKAALKHPIRSGFILSVGWFVSMWALTGFSLEPFILVPWIVASLGFGFGLMWWVQRKDAQAEDQRA